MNAGGPSPCWLLCAADFLFMPGLGMWFKSPGDWARIPRPRGKFRRLLVVLVGANRVIRLFMAIEPCKRGCGQSSLRRWKMDFNICLVQVLIIPGHVKQLEDLELHLICRRDTCSLLVYERQ